MTTEEKNRSRTWAEVRLDNIASNMKTMRAALPRGTKFLGVVKANAYGHGAVPVARRLEAEGADYLAVACLEEAEELREAGIELPVLILGHTPPERTDELIQYRVTQAVTGLDAARAYDAAAAKCGGILRAHIKADTGMSRLGFLVTDGAREAGVREIAAACRLPHLETEGISTHFAVSDEPDRQSSAEYTKRQLAAFLRAIDTLAAEGVRFALRHCANSGAVVNYPAETALDMVRGGISLYGYEAGGKLDVRPCLRLMSRVAAVKEYPAGTAVSYGGAFVTERRTRLGVLPVGYADGLHRVLSSACEFYTPSGFARQVGRVCMDMCMIDLTDLPDVGVGDEVEVFGENARLEKQAEAAGTITYELLCALSKRVPRLYV